MSKVIIYNLSLAFYPAYTSILNVISKNHEQIDYIDNKMTVSYLIQIHKFMIGHCKGNRTVTLI